MHRDSDEPLSTRLTWTEVHRLELLMRVRARSLAQRGGAADRCPGCGRPAGENGIRLAGTVVHPECVTRAAQPPPGP
jgi:hypothetical protein